MSASFDRRVSVWDAPTRLFHWAFAALVAICLVSAEAGRMDLHIPAGCGVLALTLFRIGWGFLGGRTARFADFVRGPGAVLAYVVRWFRPDPAELPVIGHNPAGGWMVLVLLGWALPTALSGVFAGRSEAFALAHGLAGILLPILAFGHVVVVMAYLMIRGEDLITPMITGWKPVPAGTEAPRLGSPVVATALLGLAGLVAIAVMAV